MKQMDREKGERLRDGVRNACSAAPERPQKEHPFPVGMQFAESVGYPRALLAELPAVSTEVFSGVSNVAVFADIPVGSIVLDLGCGAGLDTLTAARRVGPSGRLIGIDFSYAMLRQARLAVKEAVLENVELLQGDAESLPIRSGSIDVALVNGVFDLNPVGGLIVGELSRVVRRGGMVYAAELTLWERRPRKIRETKGNWFT
jgi:arsenite methyltransferase